MKRARDDRPEDGEITNTQILDELSILKDELDILKEEKVEVTKQLSEAIELRDKYKSRLQRRKERTKKWKEDLADEYPHHN
jgi:FtsZ-binding cell division protein ZapB